MGAAREFLGGEEFFSGALYAGGPEKQLAYRAKRADIVMPLITRAYMRLWWRVLRLFVVVLQMAK